jgi:hypothetical protein
MTHLIRKLRVLAYPIHPKNKHNAYNFAYQIYVAGFFFQYGSETFSFQFEFFLSPL